MLMHEKFTNRARILTQFLRYLGLSLKHGGKWLCYIKTREKVDLKAEETRCRVCVRSWRFAFDHGNGSVFSINPMANHTIHILYIISNDICEL
jgi:hypothetical protein